MNENRDHQLTDNIYIYSKCFMFDGALYGVAIALIIVKDLTCIFVVNDCGGGGVLNSDDGLCYSFPNLMPIHPPKSHLIVVIMMTKY